MVSGECVSSVNSAGNIDSWYATTRNLLFRYDGPFSGRFSWCVHQILFKWNSLSQYIHVTWILYLSFFICEWFFFLLYFFCCWLVEIGAGVYQCHDTGGNQEWTITKKGQIKHHDLCLTLVSYAKGSIVIMRLCDDSENQRWELREGGLLKHTKSNVCLDTRYVQDRSGITAELCNSGLDSQYWRFVNKHSWADKQLRHRKANIMELGRQPK